MKNDIKILVNKEIETTLKNHNNIFVFMENKKSVSADLQEIENKINAILTIKYDSIQEIKESKEKGDKQEYIKKVVEAHEKYNSDLERYHKEKELYNIILKAYDKIINNALYLLLNDIVYIMVTYCNNTRDLKYFMDQFAEYNHETKKYKYIFNLHFNGIYNKYIEISYNRPDISQYNLYKNELYLNYTILAHEKNKIVYDGFDHVANIEHIKNYSEYYKPINNIFSFENVKNNCINLLKIYDDEIRKQYKFIIESNDKIDNANVYNLDGFKKYSVI